MAALGYIMIAGMFGGALGNSVIDSMNLKKNCDNAQQMIDEMKKMHTFYNNIAEANYANQSSCEQLLNTLKSKHDEHKIIVNNYLKNNADRQRRMEAILVTSLCIIYVNFILKSNIFPMIYNYFYGKN